MQFYVVDITKKVLFITIFLLAGTTLYAKKQGQVLIDSMIAALPSMPDDTVKAALLKELSFRFTYRNTDEGIKYGEQSLKLATKLKWKKGIAWATAGIGANYEYKSAYEKTIEHYMECLRMLTEINDLSGLVSITGNIGGTYISMGNYPKALEYLFQSAKLNEKLGSIEKEAAINSNIGMVYGRQDNVPKALEYKLKALNQFRKIGKDMGVAQTLGFIGSIHSSLNAYDTALKYFSQSLELSEKLGFTVNIAILNSSIGNVYRKQKKYNDAIESFKKTLILARQLNNEAVLAHNYGLVSQTYLDLLSDGTIKQPDGNQNYPYQRNEKTAILKKAIEYGEKAVETAIKINDQSEIKQCYEILAAAYQKNGNFEKSLFAVNRFHSINDSLLSTETKTRISEMEIKYETKLKDKTIADQNQQISSSRKTNILLATSTVLFLALGLIVFNNSRKTAILNKTINKQKKDLESVNAVKDKMFNVISHDLRTPVNSLVSFTRLLDGGELPQDTLQKYVGQIKTNLGFTSELMENLLNWSLTQMQGFKPVTEPVDVTDVLQNTLGLVAAEVSNKGLKVLNNIPSGTTVLADLNMTSLLLRNVINNAIKFTPHGGAITLMAEITAETVRISVSDTGIGISENVVLQFNGNQTDFLINSTPGTNNEKGTGIGLALCRNFAKLMGGKIFLISEPQKGSNFIIELPAA